MRATVEVIGERSLSWKKMNIKEGDDDYVQISLEQDYVCLIRYKDLKKNQRIKALGRETLSNDKEENKLIFGYL